METADRILQFLREMGTDLPHSERENIATAFREILLNAIEHGASIYVHTTVEQLARVEGHASPAREETAGGRYVVEARDRHTQLRAQTPRHSGEQRIGKADDVRLRLRFQEGDELLEFSHLMAFFAAQHGDRDVAEIRGAREPIVLPNVTRKPVNSQPLGWVFNSQSIAIPEIERA